MYTKVSRCQLSGKKNATKRITLNKIANLLGYSGNASPSQSYLAKEAGCKARKTGTRTVKSLVLDNFIVKVYRPRKTCRYFFTSEFLNNRHEFYDLIPALWKISLIMLFSPISNLFAKNVPLIKYNNIYNQRSRFALTTFKAEGYGFYEVGYGKEITIPFFLKTTTKLQKKE